MLITEAPTAGLHINAGGPPVDADTTTIERWEILHAAYWRHRNALAEHRKAVAKYEGAMRELAPEYCRAVWRARAAYDLEHADGEHEGVTEDPT